MTDKTIDFRTPDFPTTTTHKKLRGFAVMDPQRVREIAAMGGTTAHRNGKAHQFTSEEARAAVRRRVEKTGK